MPSDRELAYHNSPERFHEVRAHQEGKKDETVPLLTLDRREELRRLFPTVEDYFNAKITDTPELQTTSFKAYFYASYAGGDNAVTVYITANDQMRSLLAEAKWMAAHAREIYKTETPGDRSAQNIGVVNVEPVNAPKSLSITGKLKSVFARRP